jgi:DNA (cytosine-5)-methyltransferase 1
LVRSWKVLEGDVRAVDWQEIAGSQVVDLVTGGPPCQPFSMGGKAAAADDPRDMFPAAAEVIRSLRPQAFVLENVRGLTRSSFANYFQLILLRLKYPEMPARHGESWLDHLERLQRHETGEAGDAVAEYRVVPTLVNAADYGIPQHRHRVFIIGFRADVEAEWSFPLPTHTLDRLLHDQWVSGMYWDRHGIPENARPELDARLEARIARLSGLDPETLGRPWRTVRDAIADLPEPTREGSVKHLNHRYQPGARQYPGHTGSSLDSPAKTLKAGGHGVPGGENMLVRTDGTVRYFSVREAARLQTFPDSYELHGAWSEAMRQIGNAVPVRLAEIVMGSVREHLEAAAVRSDLAVARVIAMPEVVA